MSKRLVAGAAAGVPLLGGALPMGAAAAAAAPPPAVPKHHCVTTVLTPEQLRAGQRSTITCFTTFAEALASHGMQVAADTQPAGLSDVAIGSASDLLAIHYVDPNGAGASLSVYGQCNGSGISLDASWDNKISSTRHGVCSTIKHYDSTQYSDGQETTRGGYGAGVDLGSLNDRVGSVKYLA